MADKLTSLINDSIATRQSPAQRMIALQMGSLKGNELQNLSEITNKYPGVSNDLAMSMVRSGLDINTPGLNKITTIDGIAALKNEKFKLDKIKSSVKPNRGFFGSIENIFQNYVYDPFKGSTRLLFAGLRSPYDATTAVVRDLVSVSRGEAGAKGQLVSDMAWSAFGENTTLGQLLRSGGSGTGAGFFVTPESKVGKAQAKAMSEFGKINGTSFTIGRATFNGIGMNPESNAYNIMSGVLDAVINIGTDPTTWVGPGAVGKLIGNSKKVTKHTKELADVNKSGFDTMAKEAIDELEKTGQITRDKLNKKISTPYKRFANNFKKKEQEIIAAELNVLTPQISTVTKLLNAEQKYFAFDAVDSTVKATLSSKKIAEWFIQNPKAQTGELTQAMDLLSADMKNTGGFLNGNIILDEIPKYGKISAGAHGADEYVVTANSTKNLKLVDLAETYTKRPSVTPEDLGKMTPKQQADVAKTLEKYDKAREVEAVRRSRLADEFDRLGRNASEPDFRIYQQLSTELRDSAASLDGFIGSLFVVGDELVAGKSLGSLIGQISDYKNPRLMSTVASSIEKIWKADGFTNVRSIYGKEGGVAISNPNKIAATFAEVGAAASEFADPTNLGPNVLKLIDSIKEPKAALAARQNELDDLLNQQLKLKENENWFSLLREKAHGDPEMLKELIQDPNNVGIKNLLKLELEISETSVFRESIRAQIGLTDNFMGNVGQDFSKPLKFLLGRNFKPVAELIAKETNPVKIRNLFNRKLDDAMALELADATTADDVFKVFLNQFAPGSNPLKIKNALTTGVKVTTGPMARMVPSVSERALSYGENINKALGRFYIRSTVLSLNDTTRLNSGFEDWMSSIGIGKRFAGILTRKAQESIIADTQLAIFKAQTNAERGAAVANGISRMVDEVGKSIKLTDEQIKELRNVSRLTGKDNAVIKEYTNGAIIGNKGSGLVVSGGKKIRLEGPIMESQLVQDVINLPDTRKLNQAIVSFKTNMPLYGQAKSVKVLLEETGDLWRTAQLVGRFAYVARNVAEMQMRQFFSGHESIFNSPIGFISSVIADAEGNAFQKAIAKRSKYGVNVLGEWIRSPQAEAELSASIIARKGLMRTSSVGDYGKAGRIQTVFKAYDSITPEHPDYLKGLAWTVNRYSSDKFMPDVVSILEKGTKQAQLDYVDNLIATFDKPGNKLKEFTASIFEDNDGMREILLKNPFKETGPGVVADNMNKDDILIWLFDSTQAKTVAGQFEAVAGQGSKRIFISDLIRNGEAQIPNSKGQLVTVRAPFRQKGFTSEQVLASEKSFTKQIAALVEPDTMLGSSVINMTEKAVYEGATKTAKRFTDWFFEMATKVENKLNFGPEFDASYWDFVAGYADMLTTAELKTARSSAIKALAPNGKVKIGRIPKPLREINSIYKKRLKNPNYVHKGGAELRTIDSMAATQAAEYVKNLFYDAGKQKQWANAYRLVAPFAQAHYNTLGKWAELTWSNPVPVYKAGKAFDALTKEGSNVLYDITNMKYDDNQGFLYKDEGQEQYKFKTPLVGSILGALASKSLSGKDALQIASPIESLNLAFGSLNPVVPGFGPAAIWAYQLSGRSSAFGPVDSLLQDILTPYGAPKSASDLIFPAWLKKTSAAVLGDDASTQRAVKDWAGYLASTGKYGDNPLASDAERSRLFNDAEKLARNMNLIGGLFQSISAAVPLQEVLVSVKDPKNKTTMMTMSLLYKQWKDINQKHPGDRNSAVTEFANKFGAENLLIAVTASSPGTSGSADAWAFLNNNPGISDKYSTSSGDIVPYFYPGGEFSLKYYNWQKKKGARRALSTGEIEQEAEGLVYAMLKSQVAEQQIAGRYTNFWYNEQIALLDKQFGARPSDTIVTGVNDQKIANIGLALQEPVFKESPVFKEATEFYARFNELKKVLNKMKVTNYAELSSKGGVPTLMRNDLVTLAEKLMTENPEFSRMYYGVFAGILKESN